MRLLPLLTLLGCEDVVTSGGSAASSPYTGEVAISQVSWGCCDPDQDADCKGDGLFWYDLLTDGEAGAVSLRIDEAPSSGTWAESHSLAVFEQDPDGWWTDYYRELNVVDTTRCTGLASCGDRQTADENTLFPCTSDFTEDRMTWTMRVFAPDDGRQLGCATWGVQADSQPNCDVVDP